MCVTGEVTLMDMKDAREIRKPNTPYAKTSFQLDRWDVKEWLTVTAAPHQNVFASWPITSRRAPGPSPASKTTGISARVDRTLL